MTHKHARTDVTILAAPFGFGPLGKALAIAHEFENRGMTVKIMGDVSAMKISKASGIYSENYEYRKLLNLKDLNTKIVLSCMDVSTPIIKSGIPLILVDSLFWLRGRWERFPKHNADLILAQKFFTSAPQEVIDSVSGRLHFVDAVLPSSVVSSGPNNAGKLVILYPGGMRSPYLGIDYQEKYLAWGVEVVLKAMKESNLSTKNFVTIVPPQLIDSPTVRAIQDAGGRVESIVADMGRLLRDAYCLILAPGIEIMLEACALGKMPNYIPAFNGSHIPQLMAYRKASVGNEICPSYADALREYESKTDNLSGLSKEIERQNFELLLKPKYKLESVKNLVTALSKREQVEDRFPLGKYGAQQVVDHALKMLGIYYIVTV